MVEAPDYVIYSNKYVDFFIINKIHDQENWKLLPNNVSDTSGSVDFSN